MNITTFNVEEVKTMSSLEIAELTGKRHDNVLKDIRKMFEDLEIQSREFLGYYKDSKGRTYECFNLPKDLTMTLVAHYSHKACNLVVKRWLELEEKVAKPVDTTPIPDTKLGQTLLFAEFLFRNLNLPESGKLGVMQKVENTFNLPSLTPAYGVDAPVIDGVMAAVSSEATLAITNILEGTGISPVKANKKLLEIGILEEKSRPSTTKGVKYFKSLTVKGLRYGKNLSSPSNQRETQPHYFVSKREELLALLSDLS